jgi:hypothetical protein
MEYTNIIPKEYPRSDYTSRICDALSQEIKERFEFYSVSSHPTRSDTIAALPISNKPKIIFDHEDEWHRLHYYYNRDDVVLILKDYAPFDYFRFKKIIPMPVVFNHEYPFKQQKTIEERKYLLFSSLWLSPARMAVRDALSSLESREDCRIMWNDGFAKGLPFTEYQEEMRNSVVSVCCSGYMSPEIARLHEALVAGNIIVTSRRPNYPFYKGHPFIEYDDPREIPNLVLSINNMSNKEKQELVERGNAFYKEKYSAEAMAKRIEESLNHLS